MEIIHLVRWDLASTCIILVKSSKSHSDTTRWAMKVDMELLMIVLVVVGVGEVCGIVIQ